MIPDPKRTVDETTWRNRFIFLNLVRIGGTIVVLIGLAAWHSDWIERGGSLEIGLPLALIGLMVSFGGPVYLAQRWRQPPDA